MKCAAAGNSCSIACCCCCCCVNTLRSHSFSAAGHAPAVAAARVMRAQTRAFAALKTCTSCVAAGVARRKRCLPSLAPSISLFLQLPSPASQSLVAGSCTAVIYESCEALECPHLYYPHVAFPFDLMFFALMSLNLFPVCFIVVLFVWPLTCGADMRESRR